MCAKYKFIDYSELKGMCDERHVKISKLADTLEGGRNGLITAMKNQSLKTKSLITICLELGISPNDFFQWEDGLPENAKIYVGENGINNAHGIYKKDTESIKTMGRALDASQANINILSRTLESHDKRFQEWERRIDSLWASIQEKDAQIRELQEKLEKANK